MGKKKDKIKITFLGNNSEAVTGSMTLIETPNKNILLECGTIQTNNLINDFKDNAKSFPFKPKNIDYVFVNHIHQDHVGRVPKLIRDGFDGKIICTEITKEFMKPMGLDSAKIIEREADTVTHRKGKETYPYYTESEVWRMIELTETYDYNEIYNLDEEISFRFLHNSHLLGACQLELFIKESSGHISKILYTSDLGRVNLKNYYVDDLDKCTNANIVISECTYGDSDKNFKPDRQKDLEKLKTTIHQVCDIQKGRILIPVFSLSRSQQILTDLYLMYHEDKSFKTKIILDSPLIWEITKVYKKVLKDDDLELFENACNWENVKFITDYKESRACVENDSPKIVLSSSGFLQKGRAVNYLCEYIKHPKDCIITCGYSSPNSIAGKIKSGQKNITVDGVSYKNKCGLTVLNSYSSHIQQNELLNYLKDIQCEKIYLLHGDIDGKLHFKGLLEDELRKMNKTTRIISTVKDTICHL